MPRAKICVEEYVRDRNNRSLQNSNTLDSLEEVDECPPEEWCNTYVDPCTGESVQEQYTKTFEINGGQLYEVEKCVVTRSPPVVTQPKSCAPSPRKMFYRPPPRCCQPCCKPSTQTARCQTPVRRGCNTPQQVPQTKQLRTVEAKLGQLDCRFRDVERALQDAIVALGRIRWRVLEAAKCMRLKNFKERLKHHCRARHPKRRIKRGN